MSNMNEIEQALNILLESGCEREKLLYWTIWISYSSRRCEFKSNSNDGKKFNIATGFSDHTIGIEIPIAAVALELLLKNI